MELYEKEMFNFFSTEENFLSMCKVVKNYPIVLSQLKNDFWKIVQDKIQNLIDSNKSSYKIKITGKNILDDRTKIMLYKDYWHVENSQPVIAIAIQRLAANNYPFFGPWINNDSKEMDIESMFSQCRNSKASIGFEKDEDKWFPFFKRLDINFKNDEEYLKILPSNRDRFSEMIAESVYDLAKLMEDELDSIATLRK